MTKPSQADRSLSLAQALKHGRARLQAAGIEGAALDARLLLQFISGTRHNDILATPDHLLNGSQIRAYESVLARRVGREPVARITGRRSFYDADYLIDASTLDPRPDSETLVEAVLNVARQLPASQSGQILDLGTGSGCLLIAALRQLPNWSGVGVDVQARAVRMARINAARLGVDERVFFRHGNWFDPLSLSHRHAFDVILSNPPYIPISDRRALMPEVAKFDPGRALFAGRTGLSAYEVIVPRSVAYIKAGGWLVCEIGLGQEDDVMQIFADAGYGEIDIVKDLTDRPRVVRGRYRAIAR